MAIPDNYIDKFTKDGESRMISPAADKVRVDNEHYEGDNLDDVLDEIDEKVSQAGTGNYTKPSTGIPKSDMESAVQASLGKADSAVQGIQINGGLILPKVHNNVDIFVPSRTSQLQNDSGFITADDLPEGVECDSQMSSTSEKPVQNKVIKAYVDNLINGLIDGAPAALDTLKELATALGNNPDVIANIVNTLSSKANASEVVKSISVNGQTPQTPNNGNVNVVVPMLTLDDAPTAGSNNAVKSDGIKTAIDQVTPTIDANGKWVIGGVTTDKDAQGPRGNTVLVNENAQGIQALIVNNVSDGGDTDILSAEMGKVLRINIMRLFNALGTYAFPDGKPILNWCSTVINYSINVNGVTGGLTISDVEIDGVSVASLPAQIVDGKSLSLKLNLPTGMYVFDGVAITMGGVAITNNTGVWDESTGTIYIASVTDDISITATAVDTINNYAQQSHLMFQLDGLSTGNVQDKWTDLKGGIEFTNHGATKVATGWDFANSAYMDSANAMSGMDYDQGTLEVCFTSRLTGQGYFIFAAGGSNLIMCFAAAVSSQGGDSASGDLYINKAAGDQSGAGAMEASSANVDNGVGVKIVSMTTANGYLNGANKTIRAQYFSKDNMSLIGCRQKNGTREKFFDGVIHAIRYYDTQLTAAEILANQRLDNERFNLGLTLPNS